MLKNLKLLICLLIIFFSQHIFAEEKTTQGKYIGYLENVTNPSIGMHTKFGAGILWDFLGAALSDKEKKIEQANKLISNEEVIKVYSEEIKKLLLGLGKFKVINTLESNLRYEGKDEGNNPIDKWFGERIIFGDKKGEYFQNPNFREDQEILIEYGLDHILITEDLNNSKKVETTLLIKVIDKFSSKLITKDQCNIVMRGTIYFSIQESFFENGWFPPQKCISRIFDMI